MLCIFLKNIYSEAHESRLRTVAGVMYGILNDDALTSADFNVLHFTLNRQAVYENDFTVA